MQSQKQNLSKTATFTPKKIYSEVLELRFCQHSVLEWVIQFLKVRYEYNFEGKLGKCVICVSM